jgi:hypothetical protein
MSQNIKYSLNLQFTGELQFEYKDSIQGVQSGVKDNRQKGFY